MSIAFNLTFSILIHKLAADEITENSKLATHTTSTVDSAHFCFVVTGHICQPLYLGVQKNFYM